MDLSEGQKAKILKYLLMGIGGGASMNLAFNLASYLKDKSDQVDLDKSLNPVSKNKKKVIEIAPEELEFLNKKQAAEKPGAITNTLAQALAVLALTGGSVAGYKLADMAHDKIKADELADEDRKQLEGYYKNLYLLQQAKQKKAASENENDGMRKIAARASTWVGTGLGLLLLSALGSGFLTRSILKKSYPKLDINDVTKGNPLFADDISMPIFVETKKPEEDRPVNNVRPNESVGLDTDMPVNHDKDPREKELDEKDAFSKLEKLSFEKCASYCNEALLRLCYEFEKNGKEGSVTNLVKSAAAGFTDELENSILDKSISIFELADKLVEFKKEASDHDRQLDQLALTWLASNPAVSAAIMPQIAAEFYDHAPTYVKTASAFPDKLEQNFAALLMASVIDARTSAFSSQVPISKTASIKFDGEIYPDSDLADTISLILKSNHELPTILKTV